MLKSLISILAWLAVHLVAFSQSLHLGDSIPANLQARKILLPNGFTFYIAKNNSEPGKVYIQFVVKAGVLQTDWDQTAEMPHLIEHMVFGITPSLKDYQRFEAYLKDRGFVYNAHPQLESTVFYETVENDPAVVRTVLGVYRDWISGENRLDKDVIEAGKGVVIAENIKAKRVDTSYEEELVKTSRYAEVYHSENLTIEKIAKLPAGAIRRFYTDWYRPNLSGLVVVGDVDIDATEAMIRSLFTELKNPSNARSHHSYPFRLDESNKFIATQNEEVVAVGLSYLKELRASVTYDDLKKAVLGEVLNSIMLRRLMFHPDGNNAEKVRIHYGIFTSRVEAYKALTFSLNLNGKAKFIEGGLKTIFFEIERIRRFGLSAEEIRELDHVREKLLHDLGQSRESSEDEAWRYSRNFINGDAAPSKKALDSLREKCLKEITLVDLNEFVESWLTDKNRVFTIYAPDAAMPYVPTEEMTLNWLEEVQQSKVLQTYKTAEPRVENILKKVELHVNFDSVYQLSGVSTFARKDFPEMGITQLQLSNGVKVVLRHGTSLSDRIYLEAVKSVGASEYADSKYISARLAPEFITGVGEFSGEQLDRYKIDQGVRTRFEIGNTNTVFSASSSLNAQEIMFQLIYRYFLPARKDSAAFAALLYERSKRPPNPKSEIMYNELTKLAGYRLLMPLVPWPSADEFKQIRYDLVLQSYNELFSNPAEFTFVIAGVQDIDKTIALATKYLGNLPVQNTYRVTFKQNDVGPGKLNKSITVINDRFDKNHGAEVSMIYTGKASLPLKEEVQIQMLTKLLEYRLVDRLREKEHGIYSVSGGSSTWKTNVTGNLKQYEVAFSFKCLPAIRNRLIKAGKEEAELLKKNGPRPEEFKLVIEDYRKRWNFKIWGDSQWVSIITEQYKHGGDFLDAFKMEVMINAITPADIQKVAQEYLKQDRFIAYSEVPEQ